jgi:hypothetical protein
MNSINDERCIEVQEHLADLLEGLASERVLEHVAECDECRDLRHEAQLAMQAAASAGADFRPPADFADKLIAGVVAARPEGPDASAAPVSFAARSSQADSASSEPSRTSSVESVPRGELEAAAPQLGEASPETQRTTFDPEPLGASQGEAASPRAARFEPTLKTVPLRAVQATLGDATSVPTPAPKHDSAAEQSSARVVDAVTGRADTGASAASSTASAEAADGAADARVDQPKSGSTLRSVEPAPRVVRAAGASGASELSGRGGVVSLFRKKGFLVALAGGMAAAAAVGALVVDQQRGKRDADGLSASTESPWTGSVAAVSRASSDGGEGLEICKAGCKTVSQGATIEPGSTVKTDAKTRARVSLADGTWLALDRSSEVVLPDGEQREAKIVRGMVVADVKNVAGASAARLVLPQGHVEILGTKLSATVTDRRATVDVVRGEVSVVSNDGASVRVRAGEEATMGLRGEPVVTPKSSMSESLEWSGDSAEEVEGAALTGLGELRAKKPGEAQERAKAVRLSKHDVKVRIVDVVARTEIDETFTNDTDEELEGIFRFPLPPGAQIERLALEVDGKLIDGAFVDRDRGAAIWRGVIQNAAPKAPRPREEIVWVPGPWRDPALLEWQRGGRFELRIFPIPKRGSRRVVLAYTQTVPQSAGVRRFTYPLAHDASGSTRVDEFNVDLQVIGHDSEFGVESRGYALAKASGSQLGERLTMSERSFVPAGDLTLEYALPKRDLAMTAWAYDMTANLAPVGANQSPTLSSPAPSELGKSGWGGSGGSAIPSTVDRAKQAELEAKALSDEGSPFVALALRPKLPRFAEGKERVHVIVVDSSRSMVGERFSRASRLAASIVREMDRRDEFLVMACDTTCQAMGATSPSAMPAPVEPSAEAAQEVERFLGSVEPDGGTNLLTAVQAARSAARSVASGRELRILYLGDGTPTVGPTRGSTIEAAVRHALPAGDGSVVAVALGSDADTTTLSALARGGNGVVVPYVPGQRLGAAALDVLASAYGSVLSDVTVELPSGLAELTPNRIDPVPAGGETFVFARMTNGIRASGDVVVRGRVGSERFEQRYPLDVSASTTAGNAFVPRMFAAAKIGDLERTGSSDDKPRIVALSKRFGVASRHTSLIVLESEAMFKAFGLDKNGIASRFTGEIGAQASSTDALGDEKDARSEEEADEVSGAFEGKAKKEANAFDVDDGFGQGASGLGGIGSGGGGRAPSKSGAPASEPSLQEAPAARPSRPAPSPTSAGPGWASPPPPADDPFSPSWDRDRIERRPPPPPRQNFVPMRRIFERKASFASDNQLVAEVAPSLLEAENSLRIQPDSRDKTVALYKGLMASGRVGEAQEIVARWSKRDALDPEALLARSDLAAMAGDRERALRILSGLADLRPGDKQVQKRLVAAFDRMGAATVACQHRLALADLSTEDVDATAQAVRCAQDQGFGEVSRALFTTAPASLQTRIDTASRSVDLGKLGTLSGDVRITATWSAPVDLDLALVDKAGRRSSWTGSVVPNLLVSATDATSAQRESLGLAGLASGQYVVEIVRASGDGSTIPVSGEVTMTLPGGETRRVPFTLNGSRTELGTLRVFFTSRLVPLNGGGGGWQGGGGGGWRR